MACAHDKQFASKVDVIFTKDKKWIACVRVTCSMCQTRFEFAGAVTASADGREVRLHIEPSTDGAPPSQGTPVKPTQH